MSNARWRWYVQQFEATAAPKAKLETLLPSVVTVTFRRVEIAEQEIALAKLGQNEEVQVRIHNSFKLMVPPAPLRSLADDVYRLHVRELLARVIAKQDTRPATLAEIMAVLSWASQQAPPNGQHAALMAFVFAKLFPEKGAPHAKALKEPWPGSNEELLTSYRKKLRTEERR